MRARRAAWSGGQARPPASAAEPAGEVALGALFALLLVIGLAQLLGWRLPGPPGLRLVAVWGWLVVAPGFFLSAALRAPGTRASWMIGERIALACAAGMAAVAALAWLSSVATLPLSLVSPVMVGLGGLLSGLNGLRARSPEARPSGRGQGRGSAPSLLSQGGILLVALLASLLLFRAGGTLDYAEDGLAHVAAVRAALSSDQALPPDIWYRAGEVPGPDPRLGPYHAVLALLARESALEPVDVWLLLPGLLLPFYYLGFSALARAALPRGGGWFLAGLFFLLGHGGLDPRGPRLVGDPVDAALFLSWVSAALFLAGLGGPARFGVGAAILGGLSAMMHVYGPLQAVLLFGVFGVVALLAGRRSWGSAGLGTAAGVGLVAAPYLLHRYVTSFALANPSNYVPQGVLYVSERLFVASPTVAVEWFGPAGIASFLLVPLLARGARRDAGRLLVAGGMGVAFVVLANPLLLPLLWRGLSYLALRLKYLALTPLVLGWALWHFGDRLARGPRRIGPGAVVAALLVLFWPSVAMRGDVLRAPSRRDAEGPLRWRGELDQLTRGIQGPRVVAGDAYTSYALPALTPLRVVAIPAEHASPNDPRPIERLRASEAILSPQVGALETLAALRDHGADLILLNRSYRERVEGHEFSILPEEWARQRDKFAAHPELFRPLGETQNLLLYEVAAQPGAYAVPGNLPSVTEEPELPVVGGPEAAELAAAVPLVRFPGGLTLLRFAVTPEEARPGDTVEVRCLWRCDRTTESGALEPTYWAYLRADAPYPRGWLYRPEWSKIYRKLVERREGRRFRFRVRHAPASGLYPSYRWRPGELVRDSWSVSVPGDMAPGDYVMQLTLAPTQVGMALSLRDFLDDRDRFTGVPVGRLRLR